MQTAPAKADRPLRAVTYRSVLRVPHAARLLIGTLIGRLPSGMAPLAIVLIGTENGGLQTGSGLAAVYLLANAVGGPLLGRLVDRHGQTGVLTTSAATAAAGLLLLTADGASWGVVLTAVALAGLAKPPLDATLRALWSPLMPDREHERVAVSLDAAVQELIFIVGPLLVAALAYTSSARWAVVATAAVGLAGTLLVVTAPPSRSWTAQPREVDWLGPLRSQQLRVLYTAMLFIGVPMGALTPLAVTFADQFQYAGLSGALPAAVSAGALVGGLLYGARSWPGPTAVHLVVLCAGFATGWIPLLAAGNSLLAVAACLLPGLVMAPLLSAAYLLTVRLAPAGTVTEASAVLVAALDLGCAVGTGAAGLSFARVLLPAGGAAALVVLWAARGLRRPRVLPPAVAEPQHVTT
ncbi:MFS transporter [Streptomyces turgidiscabies]|uniref:Transporter, integral membrane protein n=1 Tax=Streptomyces turgidiscabies (strain Car8) TaxID=698760 RepID=L7F5D1_STRT8|nr:MFS transporter [Streptomyces turgidiscabies]ELP66339.1 transporter, integral membrane protein [Streptomyces turgidiscabies Car8]MDX3499762.1 MFS transporter [Streptomyces turgidiscabies]GAQ77332.1 major Facilitator Superfamily protein [Streptomyces turgidiscabies]